MTNPKIDPCAVRSYDALPQTWASLSLLAWDMGCFLLAGVTALPEGSVRPPAFETVVVEQVPTVDEFDASKPGFVKRYGRSVSGLGGDRGFCAPKTSIERVEQPL